MSETPPGSGRMNDTSPYPTDAIHSFLTEIKEVREYLSYIASARLDRAKAKVMRTAVLAAMALVLALVFLTLLVSGTALLVTGAARGLAEVFPGNEWLGDLVIGGGIVGLLCLGMLSGWLLWSRSRLMAARCKYEKRQAGQRQRFATDVHEQARLAAHE